MARPNKTGLDYFPLNVDFFDDDKLRFVAARFGELGELITIKLMCKIYKNGYFVQWSDDDALLFASIAGKNVTVELVNDVVCELLKRGLFDKNMFDQFNILTSNGIQTRFAKICSDAKRKQPHIDPIYQINGLIPEKPVFPPEETPKIPSESTQSKVNESKQNENINIVDPSGSTAINISKPDKFEIRENKFIDDLKPFVETYGRDMVNAFFRYWSEKSRNGLKMRWELQKTFEIKKRLITWATNDNKTIGKTQPVIVTTPMKNLGE